MLSTAPRTESARSTVTFAEVRQQLGHFLWMSIFAVTPVMILGDWWVAMILAGVELISFWMHVSDHHEGQSWLDMPLPCFVGIALTSSAIIELALVHPGLLIILPMILVGMQVTSYAIHRLAHRQADDEWTTVWPVNDCVFMILAGLVIGYAPLAFFL